MNVEKMKEFVQVANELQSEGVYGFSVGIKQCGFHVSDEKLVNEPNLQIKGRGGSDYPYEIYVEHDGFKVFALIKTEQLKDFPQFKEQTKTELLKQLAALDQEEEVSA